MAKRAKEKTSTFTLRLQEPLRDRIEKSAAENGVSMNAEIINRIESSYNQTAMFEECRLLVQGGIVRSFGGEAWFNIMEFLCSALRQIEEIQGKSFRKDVETNSKVSEAAYRFFQRLGPKEENFEPVPTIKESAIFQQLTPDEIDVLLNFIAKHGYTKTQDINRNKKRGKK